MRKLKEFYTKRAGIFNTAFVFTMMVATADLAYNVASRIGGIPCTFTASQPKMPNSLLKKIEDSNNL